MKMLETWHAIRDTGITDTVDEEMTHRIRLVNSLSFTLSCLVVVVGSIYYALSGKLSIFIPASIECLLAGSALFLNYHKKYEAAALVTYFVQCAASVYFGLLLGNVIELQAMIIFLFLITFLLFKNDDIRMLCLTTAIIILLIIEANYYYNFVKQIPLSHNLTVIFKALSVGGVLLLIIIVGRPYVRSKDALYKANHFKRIFIYQITHELRTQLNAVYYTAQLMKRETKLDTDLKKMEPYIDLLFTTVDNTRNIINNVLDMSKIEAGKMEDIQEEALEIKPFFERLMSVHTVTAKARNIQLKLLVDERLPLVVVCDSFKLGQVAANLLSNAVKYADRNSTISLSINKCDEHTWNIQVTNKGLGIAKEKLTVIFDQFVTNKQNRYTEGTGLGLYIVKNMVRALGGDISAESQPGNDTTFTVKMKLQAGKIEDVQEEENKEDIDLSNVRILLADDNEMNNMLFSKYLSMCGCEITTASNGREALDKLGKGKHLPDVILLDHQMPEMDGAATLAHLKKTLHLRHIPVIICTGSFESQEKLVAAGASAIIVKPVDQKSLLKVISQHLPRISAISNGLPQDQLSGNQHAV
ncbi:hybrid sensor histidine kinase/response regulator [Chitinophaga japonensis]|uniref:histidine kinase n=1 Tax=Chitinophaga japonensis TaxID=104662 RepID=A0A562T6Y2_CHIJA|nr:ATP-binding protein [Chitinophaga japonensis]TWI89028.1 signal transduction histidine kinase [Chitinophaga japonensis]